MRKRFGQLLRIGVTPTELALLRCSRWGGASEVLETCAVSDGPGLEPLFVGLKTLLDSGDYAGWNTSVVVANDLVRMWQVHPPVNAARVADLEAAAGLRFHHLYGDAPSNWAISADWHASQPFLAAALPRALVAMFAQAAQDRGLAIVEIVPHFVAAWNRWQNAVRPNSWFGVLHGGVLALGATSGRRVTAVREAAVPAGADQAWLAAHVEREALRLNLEAPAAVTLCGAVPAHWNRQDGALACTVLGAADAQDDAAGLALAGAAA
jgi:hypothetical protein